MDEQKIKEMAKELSKEVKSESDLSDITRIFLKTTIENALGAELDVYFWYDKHSSDGRNLK